MELDNGKRVLIVEDHGLLANLLKQYLDKRGYESLVSVNGQDGIRFFAEYKPDIVLVDITLPDISGLEVIKQIREKSEDTPILVVSGVGDVEVAMEAVRRGAWDYLLKPIENFRTLDETIQKALNKAFYVNKEKKYLNRLAKHSQAAKKMQESLFPEERVKWNDYILSSYIIPSIDTSGDFIDYFLIDDRHFGFYLADVAGHGVAAAFLTIVLRSSVNLYLKKYHQMFDDTILNPPKILDLINSELLQENYNRHIAIIYGVIDMEKNALTFTNAGHYPVPLIFDGHKSSYIEQKGLPLGFVQKTDYQSITKDLPEAFSILVFSDGILEIYGHENRDLAKKDLLAYISSLQDDENRIVSRINELLSKRTSTDIPDDISFLLIRKTGS